jgi:hypothetical protein
MVVWLDDRAAKPISRLEYSNDLLKYIGSGSGNTWNESKFLFAYVFIPISVEAKL